MRAAVLLLVLGACAPRPDPLETDALARAVLAGLQPMSFEDEVEFCGYIARQPSGELRASPARRGTFDTCTYSEPGKDEELLASFHTHGSFTLEYDAEVPSVDDMLGDIEDGTIGYVSTPGGRLWRIDPDTEVAIQLCGLDCLPSDPEFESGVWGPVRSRYDLPALEARFAEE